MKPRNNSHAYLLPRLNAVIHRAHEEGKTEETALSQASDAIRESDLPSEEIEFAREHARRVAARLYQ